METDLLRAARALDFAARKHAAQRRKGVAAEPYLNHLAEVARLLAEATDGTDADLVIAGLLHDTLEDTPTTYGGIEANFGPHVAALVREVTDDRSLPQEARKRRQVEHAPLLPARAKMLKIADKVSNLRGVVESPPADWSAARRLDYAGWAQQVVAGCRGVNAFLEAQFDAAYRCAVAAPDQRGSLAPEVLVFDLFHEGEPEHELIYTGFPTFEDARAFARLLTRASVEAHRRPGATPEEVHRMWATFGETARVLGGPATYSAWEEGRYFAKHPAGPEQTDWRSLQALLGITVRPCRPRSDEPPNG